MKNKLWLVIAVCVAVYATWQYFYPSGSWRYKLTVEIETPEGIKTGSAVREVSTYTLPRILPEASTMESSVRGEAVVVDLGARGQVFALLSTYQHGIDGMYYIVSDAFPQKGVSVYDRVKYYRSLKDAKTVLMPSQYPMFVRFKDQRDPRTVENLLEYKWCPDPNPYPKRTCIKDDHFAEAFGEGVALKSVTIEMTETPITRGVVKKSLPWLSTIGMGDLAGNRDSGPSLAERLSLWDFEKE